MRGQVWNCKQIEWKPKGNRHHKLIDCLVIFVCFEGKDSESVIAEIARRVLQLNDKRYKKEKIAIFPFAHLSSDLMKQDKAESMIELLFEELKAEFPTAELLPFGREKEVVIHLEPENKDVSYFEY